MNTLKEYIIEKLKINKDTKVILNSKLLNKIVYILNLKDITSKYKEVEQVISNWISDNNITKIKTYMLFTTESSKYLNNLNRSVRNEILHQQLDKYTNTVKIYFPKNTEDWEKLILYGEKDFTIYGIETAILVESKSYNILIVNDSTKL